MGQVLRLIPAAFWLPLRHWRVTTRIFWPAILVLLIAVTVPAEIAMAAGQPSVLLGFIVIMLCGMVWQALVLASGLIRWHRHLILGSEPAPARLFLWGAEWRYFGRWLWLGLVTYGLGLFIIFLFSSYLELTGEVEAADAATTWAASPTGLSWSAVLGAVVVSGLMPMTCISLAAIAVRTHRSLSDSPACSRSKRFGTRAMLSVGLFSTIAPFLIAEPLLVATIDLGSNADAGTSFSNALLVWCLHWLWPQLAVVVFATFLSLCYRSLWPSPGQF